MEKYRVTYSAGGYVRITTKFGHAVNLTGCPIELEVGDEVECEHTAFSATRIVVDGDVYVVGSGTPWRKIADADSQRPGDLDIRSNRNWALVTAHRLLTDGDVSKADLVNMARICMEILASPPAGDGDV